MPSFADSIFLFVLALLLFGPKKLPVLARELGKWMGEFRRASNEFKMQMEDELRASEQVDRQKQIAAMEAAAPIPPALGEPVEPEHPHMRHAQVEGATDPEPPQRSFGEGSPEPSILAPGLAESADPQTAAVEAQAVPVEARTGPSAAEDVSTGPHDPDAAPATIAANPQPLPIAVSGSLRMMPPATGLPTPRSTRPGALAALVESIPEAPANGSFPTNGSAPTPAQEGVVHGD